MINDIDFNDTSNLKVIYVYNVGKDIDDENIYYFLLSENTEDTWAEMWEEKPAGNCGDLTPNDDMYEYVKELRTDIVLDLAQENCCFSMQDARDRIIALAFENLDNAEEYPEQGRIVVHFGDSIDDVERKLAKRDMRMRFIDK